MAEEKYKVGSKAPLGLFLRSKPDKQSVSITVLPMGQEVTKLADSGTTGWWQVAATIQGAVATGFVNSSFLVKVADFTPPPSVNSITPVHLPLGSKKVTRDGAARAYPLNEAKQPMRDGTASASVKAKQLTAIVEWLNVENKARYRANTVTYCNIYAYDYCYLAGVYLPRVWWKSAALLRLKTGKAVTPIYAETVDEINANSLFNWFKDFSAMFGWRRSFDLGEMQDAANDGQVVIISAQNKIPNKSGHICAVVPETTASQAARNGTEIIRPLQSQAGRNNHKYSTDGWWVRLASTFRDHSFWINAS